MTWSELPYAVIAFGLPLSWLLGYYMGIRRGWLEEWVRWFHLKQNARPGGPRPKGGR